MNATAPPPSAAAPPPFPPLPECDAAALADAPADAVAGLLRSDAPVVLRGLTAHWPAVQLARRAPHLLADDLRAHDSGAPVDALLLPPEEGGRIFYNHDLSGFNFLRKRLPLSAVLEQIARYARFARAPAVAVQSALVDACLPRWGQRHRAPGLAPQVPARIWVGNAVTTPTHFDESRNLACVVAGRRRFIVFPPDQIGNLYLGPLDRAPTGTPIGLASPVAPDLVRFPRFAAALAAARSAELAPGDAICIPPLWWHHVESLDGFNVLVNHWWHGDPLAPEPRGSALDCLLHAVWRLRGLPAAERAAWGSTFDHFLFAPQHPAAHLPEPVRGLLGEAPAPALVDQLRQRLRDGLAG